MLHERRRYKIYSYATVSMRITMFSIDSSYH